MYLLASYVFHIRVLEVKWSDESHIFTFNAGMYWIHKSPHAFRLVHWSALHQVCYHAKSTVTDLVVASRKYIFCLCIPKPASRESQNPSAYPGMVLGFIFKHFDVSVWFRTWDYIYSCWYFERERGHCTVRFLSCGINEILTYFVSGFSFSKCMRPKPFTALQSLHTHFSMNYHFRIIECMCKWKFFANLSMVRSRRIMYIVLTFWCFSFKIKKRLTFIRISGGRVELIDLGMIFVNDTLIWV